MLYIIILPYRSHHGRYSFSCIYTLSFPAYATRQASGCVHHGAQLYRRNNSHGYGWVLLLWLHTLHRRLNQTAFPVIKNASDTDRCCTSVKGWLDSVDTAQSSYSKTALACLPCIRDRLHNVAIQLSRKVTWFLPCSHVMLERGSGFSLMKMCIFRLMWIRTLVAAALGACTGQVPGEE